MHIVRIELVEDVSLVFPDPFGPTSTVSRPSGTVVFRWPLKSSS
jgi:hypothetical protein